MNNEKQPVFFVSHGSPMMAVETSITSQFLQRLGKDFAPPKAIVVFSAHFDLNEDIVITSGKAPSTVHDFYGFPQALYQINYNAPGSPVLAEEIASRFKQAGYKPNLSAAQGWDHGVWIPLRLMYPEANIPVVQVSINSHLDPQTNYNYGALLASLRDEGVMIIGSGGVSHNLRELFNPNPTSNRVEKVQTFVSWVNHKLGAGDKQAMLNYLNEAPHVMFNHPTQEHFVPLIAVLGASDGDKAINIHTATENEVLALDAYKFN
mgnify:CR=1 FL=1